MPLLPTKPEAATPSRAAGGIGEAQLLSGSRDERWAAARAMGGSPESTPALARALAQETDVRVREAIFTALARIATIDSAAAIIPYVRSDDAQVRTAALDALRAMPGATKPHLPALLTDQDADVRILVCDLLRGLPAEDATPLLCALLENEPLANVCAAAVDVLAEIGADVAVPSLLKCAERFHGDAFLPFAIEVVVGQIRAEAPKRG
jgi:HEAT repeat protein